MKPISDERAAVLAGIAKERSVLVVLAPEEVLALLATREEAKRLREFALAVVHGKFAIGPDAIAFVNVPHKLIEVCERIDSELLTAARQALTPGAE